MGSCHLGGTFSKTLKTPSRFDQHLALKTRMIPAAPFQYHSFLMGADQRTRVADSRRTHWAQLLILLADHFAGAGKMIAWSCP